MEIKYLKLIKTIAEEGNISNSANRLFLTQSALSHQLKDIEERLGFKIFIRTRNNWKLSKEGTELYHLSKSVLKEIDERMLKIKDIRSGSNGIIRVSTECYTFYHGLPEFIQKMAVLYPQIDIKMMVEDTHRPLSKLLSNDLDISIVTSKPDNEKLIPVKLYEDEVFAVLHKEHELAKEAFIAPTHFADQHLIIHSFPLETVFVYQSFLKQHKIEPAKITAIPLTEVAIEMVNANMGITCLPKWALKNFKIADTLTFKRLGENGLRRKHYVVYRVADSQKAYIMDFIDSIQDEFAIQ